eukprot:CAMPEP_0113469122 /NCGR_PEP_ID=MMETSP0014_2-20120614/15731_1 /TAXON_ID=2857 /ORGANISM="Nitzschia sp." /LENGTH=554 /DNA_ID=CAMNT_0000361579 /DNA_START=402 /DNA_END=2064 /DNA_ORIENTATION=+ /assembly_acc=CAM_ASM_000159
MEMDSSVDYITRGTTDGVENRRYDDNRSKQNDQAMIVRRRVRERFRQSRGKATTNYNGEARSTHQPHHRDNNTKTTRTKTQITRLQYHRHQHHLVMLELKIDALRRRSSTIGRRYVHDPHQASSDNAAASRTISPSAKVVSESTDQVSSLRTLPSTRESVPVSREEDTCPSLHSKASDEHASLSGRGNDVNGSKYPDSMDSLSRHVTLPSKELDLEKSRDVHPDQNGYHIDDDDDALAIANARRSIEEAKMFLAARKLVKRSKEEVKQKMESSTTELDCFTTPVDQFKNHQSQESEAQKISFPLPLSKEIERSNQDFVQFELSFPLDEPRVSVSQSEEAKAESMNDYQDDDVASNSCKASESSQSMTEKRNMKADVTLEQEYKRNQYSIKKLFSCSSSGSRNDRAHHHDKLDLRINGSSTHSSSRGNTAEVSDQLTNSTSQDGGSDCVRGYRKIKSIDIQKKSGKSTAAKWYIRHDEQSSKPVTRRSSNGSFFFGRKNVSRAVSATGQDPTEHEGVMDMIFFDVVQQQQNRSDLEVVPEDHHFVKDNSPADYMI